MNILAPTPCQSSPWRACLGVAVAVLWVAFVWAFIDWLNRPPPPPPENVELLARLKAPADPANPAPPATALPSGSPGDAGTDAAAP